MLVSLGGLLFDEDQVRRYTGADRAFNCVNLIDENDEKLNYVVLHLYEWLFLHTKMPACLVNQLLYTRLDPPPAYEDLVSHSVGPLFGCNSTLPQHRFHSHNEIPRPAQDEYPVTYFLYNDLMDRSLLMWLLGLSEPPTFEPAFVLGSRMMLWGRYRSLIDGEESDRTDGVIFTVLSAADEGLLSAHETGKHEVVRCVIHSKVDDLMVRGLTFRFRASERSKLRELGSLVDSEVMDNGVDVMHVREHLRRHINCL